MPRAKIFLDPLQLPLAFQQNIFGDCPAFGVHPHGFVEQTAGADIVSTDDDVFPIKQIERGELRQRADQADFAD